MSQLSLPIATVTFPEIRLATRDGHKLRGHFGTVFKEHSPLLHNHYDDGSLRYGYPLVQYKVVAGTPMLVGIQEGAKLLTELFFQMKTIRIEGEEYPVLERDISFQNLDAGVGDGLFDYRFLSPWMALNQENYKEYLQKDIEAKRAMLGRILTGNMLSFFKGIGLYLPEGVRIMATVRPKEERLTGFKDNLMTAFNAEFTTNVLLPNFIGLGKSVSRGYGAIKRVG